MRGNFPVQNGILYHMTLVAYRLIPLILKTVSEMGTITTIWGENKKQYIYIHR